MGGLKVPELGGKLQRRATAPLAGRLRRMWVFGGVPGEGRQVIR
ncbi:hypothetical protein SAMN06265784_107111 [Paraburkholderia susongensis]|uniref:Uncharacterized protein n=1 Tax=Paraburkholderia susongensis TaxID=1515439 RepID=A0A1X7LME7_9BURK|nr:hypothetical protein SAMN06265784_107111 [Paraburkholderia susongensis]